MAGWVDVIRKTIGWPRCRTRPAASYVCFTGDGLTDSGAEDVTMSSGALTDESMVDSKGWTDEVVPQWTGG